MAARRRSAAAFTGATATLFFLVLFAPLAPVSAKSPRAITEAEIATNKNACYADIESGLWGWDCKSSQIAKENCALRCLSPQCYELIYESDPLEEGERDFGPRVQVLYNQAVHGRELERHQGFLQRLDPGYGQNFIACEVLEFKNQELC